MRVNIYDARVFFVYSMDHQQIQKSGEAFESVFVCVCLNTTAQQVASLQDKIQLQCVPYR